MMNRVMLLIGLMTLAVQLHAQQLRMDIRLLGSRNDAEAVAVVNKETGEQFYLLKNGIKLYDHDISSVRFEKDRFGSRVNVSLTPAASEGFYHFTSHSIGTTVGILIGGELEFVNTVVEPIRDTISLTGLRPKRLQEVALLIGGGKLSPKGPMSRAVFVGTESEDAGIDTKKLSYVVLPNMNKGEYVEAAAIVSEAMSDAGYRILSKDDLKGADTAKIAFVTVKTSDPKDDRFYIEIAIGLFRGPIENRDMTMIWRGVFGMDPEFYRGFIKTILKRTVGYYGKNDIKNSEVW